MRQTRMIMVAAAASAMAFAFVSCADDDGTEYAAPVVELPASVGENPFAGKTFTNSYNTDDGATTYVFSEKTYTAIWTRKNEDEFVTSKDVYAYSYDAEKSLILCSSLRLQRRMRPFFSLKI